MRIIQHHINQSGKTSSRKCEAPGCLLPTREGKPFCTEHVELNPHASFLVKEIANRDEEDDMVRIGDTPADGYNIDGITATSITQHLAEHGPRTKERICKELGIDRAVLDGYADELIRLGVVSLGHTRRGSELLTLR